jgi:hypothetical protein
VPGFDAGWFDNAEDKGLGCTGGQFTLVLYHPLGAAEKAQAGMSTQGFDSGGRPYDEQTHWEVPTDMQLVSADENWHRQGQRLANVPKNQEAALTQQGRIGGHLAGDQLIDGPSRLADYSSGRFYDFPASSRSGARSDRQQGRCSWPNGKGVSQLGRPLGRVHASYSRLETAGKQIPMYS